jgi:glutamate-5-semialdehyde dehydrogenase
MAAACARVAALPDPVGELLEELRRPDGLLIRKVRVPLGVVGGRLRGSTERDDRRRRAVPEVRQRDRAARIVERGAFQRGAERDRRPRRRVGGRAGRARSRICRAAGRDELAELATQDRYVDLIIPRGGEGLKAALLAHATVPVIYAASGNCHVYVDAAADLDQAREIVLNAKVQRPGVCNAAETLLVHRDVAAEFLPSALAALRDAGVELRGDERARELRRGVEVAPASAADWDTEYLALTLAVAVVDSLEDAIEHIAGTAPATARRS